jgi:hypothetical protein
VDERTHGPIARALAGSTIVGKVFRLGLIGTRRPNRHPNPVRRNKPASKPNWKPPPRPEAPAITDDDLTMQEFLALELFELTAKQCRYPHGDRVPYAFCGQPVAEGSSYCEHHHRLAYHPAAPARRDRYYFAPTGRAL